LRRRVWWGSTTGTAGGAASARSRGGGTTDTKRAICSRYSTCNVDSSSALPARRTISERLRLPSTTKKTFHSSGVRVTVCLTRSGFAIDSTTMSRSGKATLSGMNTP
jgi:hypothetical protein